MWNLMHFLLKLDGYLLEVWLTGWLGLQDMAEHLTTVYLSHCERGQRCLYEGSTPPGGFPNSWVWCISPTCMLFWWLTKLAWAWILCLCNCWVRYWFMNERACCLCEWLRILILISVACRMVLQAAHQSSHSLEMGKSTAGIEHMMTVVIRWVYLHVPHILVSLPHKNWWP